MNYIILFVAHYGYLAIFTFMMMTAMMIPIPSEVIMPFAGFMVQQGHLNFFLVILLGALGDLAGSLIAYALGYYLEDHIVLTLIHKYGKYILFRQHEYERALRWFDKYGSIVVFFGKAVPGVRSFVSLPAGLAKMNIKLFALYAFLGTLFWSTFLTIVGFYTGKNWEQIHTFLSKIEYVIALIIIIAIAYFFYKHLKKGKGLRGKGKEITD